MELVRARRVLEAVSGTLAPEVEAIAVSVQGELPLLRADLARLGRAFANLLDNGLRLAAGSR